MVQVLEELTIIPYEWSAKYNEYHDDVKLRENKKTGLMSVQNLCWIRWRDMEIGFPSFVILYFLEPKRCSFTFG